MGGKRGADLLINSSSIYLYHLSLAPHFPSDVSCILFFSLLAGWEAENSCFRQPCPCVQLVFPTQSRTPHQVKRSPIKAVSPSLMANWSRCGCSLPGPSLLVCASLCWVAPGVTVSFASRLPFTLCFFLPVFSLVYMSKQVFPFSWEELGNAGPHRNLSKAPPFWLEP